MSVDKSSNFVQDGGVMTATRDIHSDITSKLSDLTSPEKNDEFAVALTGLANDLSVSNSLAMEPDVFGGSSDAPQASRVTEIYEEDDGLNDDMIDRDIDPNEEDPLEVEDGTSTEEDAPDAQSSSSPDTSEPLIPDAVTPEDKAPDAPEEVVAETPDKVEIDTPEEVASDNLDETEVKADTPEDVTADPQDEVDETSNTASKSEHDSSADPSDDDDIIQPGIAAAKDAPEDQESLEAQVSPDDTVAEITAEVSGDNQDMSAEDKILMAQINSDPEDEEDDDPRIEVQNLSDIIDDRQRKELEASTAEAKAAIAAESQDKDMSVEEDVVNLDPSEDSSNLNPDPVDLSARLEPQNEMSPEEIVSDMLRSQSMAPPKGTSDFVIPVGDNSKVLTEDASKFMDKDPLFDEPKETEQKPSPTSLLDEDEDDDDMVTPDDARLEGQKTFMSEEDIASNMSDEDIDELEEDALFSGDDFDEQLDQLSSDDDIEEIIQDVGIDPDPSDLDDLDEDTQSREASSADTDVSEEELINLYAESDIETPKPDDTPSEAAEVVTPADAKKDKKAKAGLLGFGGKAKTAPPAIETDISTGKPKKAKKGLMSSSSIIPVAAAVVLVGMIGFAIAPNQIRGLFGGSEPGPTTVPLTISTDTQNEQSTASNGTAQPVPADPGPVDPSPAVPVPDVEDIDSQMVEGDPELDDVLEPLPDFGDDLRMAETGEDVDDLGFGSLDDDPVAPLENIEEVTPSINLAEAEEIQALQAMVEDMQATVDGAEERFASMMDTITTLSERNTTLEETVEAMNVTLNSQSTLLSEIFRLEDQVQTIELSMADISTRFRDIEGINVSREARIAAETAVSVNVQSMESRLEDRLDQLNANIGIIARMAANGTPSGPRPPVNSGGNPPQSTNPGDVFASNSSTGNPDQENREPRAPSSSSFTVSNTSGASLRDVSVGDHVEGYGMVLNIRPASGGGNIVVMENGAIFVD